MFVDGFEKLAMSARIFDAFENHLGKHDPEGLKALNAELDRRYKNPTKFGSPAPETLENKYQEFLKHYEALGMKEYEEMKDKPKRGVGSGLAAGALRGLAGGALGALLGSPFALSNKTKAIHKGIAGAGALAGAVGGYRQGRKNSYYGMKPAEAKKLNSDYREHMPRLIL